jgi:hypothetical protein
MLVAILKVVLKMVFTGSETKRWWGFYPWAGLLFRAPFCTKILLTQMGFQ